MSIYHQYLCLQLVSYFVHEKYCIGICFSAASCEVLWQILTEAKTLIFFLNDAYNYIIDAYVCFNV